MFKSRSTTGEQGAEEDFAAAQSLLAQGHLRHALFFAHLALEKMLKAHVARATKDVPPRTHDLLRLADTGGVSLPRDRRAFLARLQQYCLESRYPESQIPAPSREDAQADLGQAQEVLEWLKKLLK